MKKYLALLLAGLMMFSLMACGDDVVNSDPVSSQDTLTESSAPEQDLSAPESSEPEESDVQVQGDKTTTSGRQRTTTTKSQKVTTTTRPAFTYSTENEKPITYDISILYNEMHSQSDAEAAVMKQKVLDAKDEVKPSTTGTTYYVSYKGNDANDGKSPSKAWRTTKRVGEAAKQFKAGDVVLFERGGVYRGSMYYVSGMKIGAYGSGPKPQLYAGPCNVADPTYWEQTKYENVWKLNVAGMTDIGNIVFDYGKVCASTTRMFKEFLITEKKYKAQDFYYYHNEQGGYLYMYYSKGNPGEDFESIELCPHNTIITRAPHVERKVENVVVDNLCLRYTGAFGITMPNVTNATVTNCEIGYIGGSLQNVSVRYGNGIEFNGEVHGAEVRNNWIYQCYDAGYTHQCGGVEENVHVDANLIEYCNYNIEYFLQSPGNMHNMIIENNILRFAGYGFGSKNRYGSGIEYIAHISGNKTPVDCKGAVVRNNILDTALVQLVMESNYDGVNGPIFEGNTWIQWNDKWPNGKGQASAFNPFDKTVNSDPNPTLMPAKDQKTLEESIKKVDKNPKAIIFYEKK